MSVHDAMQRLALSGKCGETPTVGAIAAEAGLSYVETAARLANLQAQGLAHPCERVKADNYAIRWKLYVFPPRPVERVKTEAETIATMRHIELYLSKDTLGRGGLS